MKAHYNSSDNLVEDLGGEESERKEGKNTGTNITIIPKKKVLYQREGKT